MISQNSHFKNAVQAVRLIAGTATKSLIPGLPPYLVFFLTHRCNARCDFCFDRHNQESAADTGQELSLSEIEKIAANWRGIIQVTLTGGEPFLRGDIVEVALAFARAGAKSITIASNGILADRVVSATRAILESAPGLFFDLDLSLDGPEDVHDRLRGVAGAYQKVMEASKRLSPLQGSYPGFRLGATVTVSAFNQEYAGRTVQELIEGGLFQRVQALWIRGRPFDPRALECDFCAYESCCEILSEKKTAGGMERIREALSARVREVVVATVRENRMVLPCRAGRTMVMVSPEGHVYPCEMLMQMLPEGVQEKGIKTWTMGSLREQDYSIGRVVSSDQAKQVTDWIKDSDCYCSFECAAYNNIVFNPRQWAGITRRIITAEPQRTRRREK